MSAPGATNTRSAGQRERAQGEIFAPGALPLPVRLMGLLLLLVLLAVAWQRWAGPDISTPSGELLWERSLRFEDRPNGDIAVLDANTAAEVAQFSGEQGFVRGVLRSLARERMRQGLGDGPAFVLSAHGSGRLVLRDPATGERIHLDSFGPSNAAAFAELRFAATAPIHHSQGVTP